MFPWSNNTFRDKFEKSRRCEGNAISGPIVVNILENTTPRSARFIPGGDNSPPRRRQPGFPWIYGYVLREESVRVIFPFRAALSRG